VACPPDAVASPARIDCVEALSGGGNCRRAKLVDVK